LIDGSITGWCRPTTVIRTSLKITAYSYKAALNQTDDQAAEQLQKECSKLFNTKNERDLKSG
jgi:hypothetical protein